MVMVWLDNDAESFADLDRAFAVSLTVQIMHVHQRPKLVKVTGLLD